MFIFFLLPFLAFIPGSALLHLISSRYSIKISPLETIVLGSVIWNYVLISCGYVVGVLSNRIREFFIIFTLASLALLTYWGYRLLIKKSYPGTLRFRADKLLIAATIPAIILVFTITLTHTVFVEYDAIFLYLPSAKSILDTGGLQFDYYQQSGLSTTSAPALPIIYAWLMYLCSGTSNFDLIVRIIPFTYILLTAFVVFLVSKGDSKDSNTGVIATLCFLSMPVVLAVASNYSLYLDIPFTYLVYLELFILLKLYAEHDHHTFWWLILGLVTSLLLLEKNIAYLILPSHLALVLFPFLQRPKKALQIASKIALSLIFTGTYTLISILDFTQILYGLHVISLNQLSGVIIRQIPVIIVQVLFLLLLLKLPEKKLPAPKIRYFAVFCISLIPVILYLLRNLLFFGSINATYPLFNEDWKSANKLIVQTIGVSGILPLNLFEVLRWDILFSSSYLGAILPIAPLTGVFSIIYDFVKQEGKRRFLLISFLLMLLGLWSWAFRCDYKGSELRRLYYFAPLFAIFMEKGIQVINDHTIASKSVASRFIIFISLSLTYLWASRFRIISSDSLQLLNLLSTLDVVDIDMLLISAFFFILSFYPIPKNVLSIKRNIEVLFHKILPLTLLASIMLLTTLVVPISFNGLSNLQDDVRYVPSHWENDLHEVISYLNQEVRDNLTIVTCYAMPISYFTSHPVIEVVRSDGIMNLLNLNGDGREEMSIIEHNIGYLLLPKPGHSHYEYFGNLSKNITFLSADSISRTPYIMLSKEFSKFKLYKVMLPKQAVEIYRYLTFFGSEWVALDNCSEVIHLTRVTKVKGTSYSRKAIADDAQDLFWMSLKQNPDDIVVLLRDSQTKVVGNDSLKMDVNGKGNMVIMHEYESPQNWGAFSNLTMYLFGANTSKDIVITLHTEPWKDYYYKYIEDDFTGWKKISMPLNSFNIKGEPSWTSIRYIENLFGERKATYYIDEISLEGYTIGLRGSIPPITTNSSQLKMTISIGRHDLKSFPTLKIISPDRELSQTLADGVNFVVIPSDLLRANASLILYYHQSGIDEEMELYYLTII